MTESDALERALRLLARKPRTEHELRRALERQGAGQVEIERVCQRLRRQGYLDDRALAEEFLRIRSERLGHGPRRMLEDLERRGVPRDTARAALAAVVDCGDLRPRELLRSRLRRHTRGAATLDRRSCSRVYNALLRAGFEEEMVRQELEPYLDEATPPDAAPVDETHDDFR